MSTTKPNRGEQAAFARPFSESKNAGYHGNRAQEGVTVREYFAAKALQGLLAGGGDGGWTPDGAARRAVTLADALLEELAK